jgi:hypothetical protein
VPDLHAVDHAQGSVAPVGHRTPGCPPGKRRAIAAACGASRAPGGRCATGAPWPSWVCASRSARRQEERRRGAAAAEEERSSVHGFSDLLQCAPASRAFIARERWTGAAVDPPAREEGVERRGGRPVLAPHLDARELRVELLAPRLEQLEDRDLHRVVLEHASRAARAPAPARSRRRTAARGRAPSAAGCARRAAPSAGRRRCRSSAPASRRTPPRTRPSRPGAGRRRGA